MRCRWGYTKQNRSISDHPIIFRSPRNDFRSIAGTTPSTPGHQPMNISEGENTPRSVQRPATLNAAKCILASPTQSVLPRDQFSGPLIPSLHSDAFDGERYTRYGRRAWHFMPPLFASVTYGIRAKDSRFAFFHRHTDALLQDI
jgi:hypothetical protein